MLLSHRLHSHFASLSNALDLGWYGLLSLAVAPLLIFWPSVVRINDFVVVGSGWAIDLEWLALLNPYDFRVSNGVYWLTIEVFRLRFTLGVSCWTFLFTVNVFLWSIRKDLFSFIPFISRFNWANHQIFIKNNVENFTLHFQFGHFQVDLCHYG